MDEWMDEWMNEWMDEWMDEWMNEWMQGLAQGLAQGLEQALAQAQQIALVLFFCRMPPSPPAAFSSAYNAASLSLTASCCTCVAQSDPAGRDEDCATWWWEPDGDLVTGVELYATSYSCRTRQHMNTRQQHHLAMQVTRGHKDMRGTQGYKGTRTRGGHKGTRVQGYEDKDLPLATGP